MRAERVGTDDQHDLKLQTLHLLEGEDTYAAGSDRDLALKATLQGALHDLHESRCRAGSSLHVESIDYHANFVRLDSLVPHQTTDALTHPFQLRSAGVAYPSLVEASYFDRFTFMLDEVGDVPFSTVRSSTPPGYPTTE